MQNLQLAQRQLEKYPGLLHYNFLSINLPTVWFDLLH
jgi:hypothetical protein